jgi:methylmalonyl-CoA mutase cobalamin-binding subunit
MKKILLAPLDPVHDNAAKLIQRRLSAAGYDAVCMPPGTTPEEVIAQALKIMPDVILISRTLGYQVAEILGHFVDLADAAGLRETTRLGVGGMALTREAGAELGFDAIFIGDLDLDALIAFIEDKPNPDQATSSDTAPQVKPDLTAGYTYQFHNPQIKSLLDGISDQILSWAKDKTSDGIERAIIRAEAIDQGIDLADAASPIAQQLRKRYLEFCDPEIRSSYLDGHLPPGVRRVLPSETERLPKLLTEGTEPPRTLRHHGSKPLFFVQYGTGCPVMDVMHIRTSQAWGADGVLHFDPSWGAQREGLLSGLLSHEHDGTILTLENLKFIHAYLPTQTLWNIRGHRGLNTPETQVIGAAAGADLFKINIPYGATGGGTDPARLTVDGVYSLMLAAKYGIPFDIPGNDELSGVPPHKTFAGILIMMALGLKLGARPIPKPLLCNSPYMQMSGEMDENSIDINAAKLSIWREIVDTPVWPGEPVGFMTHTPERVQSAVSTAAYASLAASLGVDVLTMASSDEAYSKGPISAQARVDTLRGVREMVRFVGNAGYAKTSRSQQMQERLLEGIIATLQLVSRRGDFVASIYEGLLGSPEDGLYPGRTGKGTVRERQI